jgi:membrane protein
MSLKQIWRLLKETFDQWKKDKVFRLAAALSYYTLFSVAPLLIIVIAIGSSVFGENAARGEIIGQIQGLVGQKSAEAIQAIIQNAAKPNSNEGTIASFISVFILMIGASGMFIELQDALNTIWEIEHKSKFGFIEFIRKRLLTFAMIVVIVILFLISLIISSLLAVISNITTQLFPGLDLLFDLVNLMASFSVITLLFAMIYKYLPDVKITWTDVSVGAIITALLFVMGQYFIGLYLGNNFLSSTYGAASSLVIVLVWTYYSAQILYFGAEFTKVYSKKYGSSSRLI